jgi:transcription antitermination factor NusG
VSQKWYAIYTRPRWEKKVHQLLQQKDVESYCPLNMVRKKWSDRIKIVHEPLFKSYVFVKINDDDKTAVRLTTGVMNFVYWNGKPAIIREKEIETIKKFMDEHENVVVEYLRVEKDERVQIDAGPLMGQEGTVIEVRAKTVKVVIDSLGCALVATIERTKLSSAKLKFK